MTANIDIPGYKFYHDSSPSAARSAGMYSISNLIGMPVKRMTSPFAILTLRQFELK